jgi:hypothetical protein
MPDEAYTKIQVGGHRGYGRQGVALVDDADAEALAAHRWSIDNGYAARNAWVEDGRRLVYMHREILGLGPDDPREVDHVYGNTLDNRRSNLRVCTHAQNHQNRHNRPYRGTYWHARAKRWAAQAELTGKTRYLGLYDTQEEAAAVAAAFRRQHMPYSRDARE